MSPIVAILVSLLVIFLVIVAGLSYLGGTTDRARRSGSSDGAGGEASTWGDMGSHHAGHGHGGHDGGGFGGGDGAGDGGGGGGGDGGGGGH